MSSNRGEALEALRRQQSEVLGQRQQHELKPVAPVDRLGLRKAPPEHVRSVQLNLRVSPRFKQQLAALAIARNESVTEVMVKAFYAYAERERS